jgi:predicted esterase
LSVVHRGKHAAILVLALALLACSGQSRDRSRPAEPPAPPPPIVARAAVEPSAPTAPPPAAPELPDVPTEWCAEGWRGLDVDACYFLPEAPSSRLLIYLPGIIPPVPKSAQKDKVARIVAAAAQRAGAVALLPRGRRGIGPADAKDWWAWPTSAADVATYGATLVAEWHAERGKLEAALGRHFARTYLAGSSSGAYFLAALAVRGGLDVDGFAAASGGAPGLATPGAGVAKRPFYVGWGAADPTSGGPRSLAVWLTAAGWPVRAREHPGGHGAREEYLDEAFAFWAGAE